MTDSTTQAKSKSKKLRLVTEENRHELEVDLCTLSLDENLDHWVKARYAEFVAEYEETLSKPIVETEGARVLVFHGVDGTGDKEVSKRLESFTNLVGQYLPMVQAGGVGENLASELDRLHATAPWLEDAVNSLRRSIRLSIHRSAATGFRLSKPLLLVGEPGIGKSWFAQNIPQILGIPFFTIAASGKSDNMSLKGAARGWSSARPGEVVQFIADKKVANVFIVVDEIDKVGRSNHNGNFSDTLLQMFEPENARHWRDEFLLGRVDLSSVNWVCTANSLDNISEPLRSRMDIVHLIAPRDFAERRTMLNQMARQVAREYGVAPSQDEDVDFGTPWPDFISEEQVIREVAMNIRTPRAARKVLEGLMDLWLMRQVDSGYN